ncbi:hypothetical protein MPLB_780032 [Mesorhizobium sp. ORS 3324]|nr:hypothetical protein MPLB_780032 [Mesorhizobium sp. ORS 3324]
MLFAIRLAIRVRGNWRQAGIPLIRLGATRRSTFSHKRRRKKRRLSRACHRALLQAVWGLPRLTFRARSVWGAKKCKTATFTVAAAAAVTIAPFRYSRSRTAAAGEESAARKTDA